MYTGLLGELEQLKTMKRLIDEKFANVVYYKSRKRESKAKLMNESV